MLPVNLPEPVINLIVSGVTAVILAIVRAIERANMIKKEKKRLRDALNAQREQLYPVKSENATDSTLIV